MFIRFPLLVGTLLAIAFTDSRAFALVGERLVPRNGVIQSPGYYYLASDRVSVSDINIDIQSDDVTLNLNGKKLITKAVNPATAVTSGIRCNGKNRVQILNGKVTGAFFGVQAVLTNDLKIENVDFSGNTYIGVNFSGSRAKILGCTFTNLGGYEKEAYSVGVNSSEAKDAIIANNSFINLYRQSKAAPSLTGEGVGVLLSHGTERCQIFDNTFLNDKVQSHTYGIWAVGRNHAIQRNAFRNHDHAVVIGNETVVENNFIKTDPSLPYSIGIGGAAGRSKGNLIYGFKTAITPQIDSVDDFFSISEN